MTTVTSGSALAQAIQGSFPTAVSEVYSTAVVLDASAILGVCGYFKDAPGLAFDYLADLTAVDYIDYFEVVYQLLSMSRNASATLKVRCQGRKAPSVPSVAGVWHAANFLEREVYDLFGIDFPGHPDLRRIMLFEGFPGHPLRKDFLEFDHRTIGAAAQERE